MTPAEQLAREILRVATLRGRLAAAGSSFLTSGEFERICSVIDGALEAACRAIGRDDVVAIEAAGQALGAIVE